ncbi:ACP S-malonyltransferase [Sphingomicrobium lutaoense]|uniref:Malonyl CoA-acyl carrier protein transacylase n=1 Tax=Sphingomicrobium lutaoense TaxID=515949 RepID=A0A839YYM1_9SPHN|nr:ACP S-malonyltransferase [Sphingomicrobium lutaoense]MBB3764086.1 [acyl-carrier-protein] S-malonyltransferase [Sphingomicrobium lutaoense]
MRAFIFPGQGSQKVGMGVELVGASSAARDTFGEVDEALGQHLFKLMAEGPADELTMTANAQPAIMAHSIAVLRTMGIDLADKGDFVAGHSLGEYSALCGADTFDLADTARLLRIRGNAMQEAVPVGMGAMAALLGVDIAKAEEIAAACSEGEVCEVANDNDPGQVVLSGHAGAIDRVVERAREMGAKRAIKLPVSAPFHCSLMKPAADRMAVALSEAGMRPPSAALYANVTAEPVREVDVIRDNLVRQVTGRVRWRESVAAMADAGVTQFVELGGKVLGPMVKKIVPDAETVSIVSMDDIEAFAKEL